MSGIIRKKQAGEAWETVADAGGGGGAPSGPAGGDLGGTYPNPEVNAVSLETLVGTTDYSGVSLSATAGETLAFGDPVYVKSDGKVWKADADGAGTFPAVGLCVVGGAANASVAVLLHGTVRNTAWTWTVGGAIYLSAAAGLTQSNSWTPGMYQQIIGVAYPDADTILVTPIGQLPAGWFANIDATGAGVLLATQNGTTVFGFQGSESAPGVPQAASVNIGNGGLCQLTLASGDFIIQYTEAGGGECLIYANQTNSDHMIFGDHNGNPVITVGDPAGNGDTALSFFGATPVVQPAIAGALSAVVDPNVKAVLTSIIAALATAAGVGLVADGTT